MPIKPAAGIVPALALAFTLALSLSAPGARALELGLTSSQVYGMWANINDAILAAGAAALADPVIRDRVKSIETKLFSGKESSDVLKKIADFHDKLNLLRTRNNPKENHPLVPVGGRPTPSDVFIRSGHVLDELAEWLITKTSPDTLITPFYESRDFSGKTFSDVYGLVDLADRRLTLILEKSASLSPRRPD